MAEFNIDEAHNKFLEHVPENYKSLLPKPNGKVITLISGEKDLSTGQKQMVYIVTFNVTLLRYFVPDKVKQNIAELITIALLTDKNFLYVVKDKVQ